MVSMRSSEVRRLEVDDYVPVYECVFVSSRKVSMLVNCAGRTTLKGTMVLMLM